MRAPPVRVPRRAPASSRHLRGQLPRVPRRDRPPQRRQPQRTARPSPPPFGTPCGRSTPPRGTGSCSCATPPTGSRARTRSFPPARPRHHRDAGPHVGWLPHAARRHPHGRGAPHLLPNDPFFADEHGLPATRPQVEGLRRAAAGGAAVTLHSPRIGIVNYMRAAGYTIDDIARWAAGPPTPCRRTSVAGPRALVPRPREQALHERHRRVSRRAGGAARTRRLPRVGRPRRHPRLPLLTTESCCTAMALRPRLHAAATVPQPPSCC